MSPLRWLATATVALAAGAGAAAWWRYEDPFMRDVDRLLALHDQHAAAHPR